MGMALRVLWAMLRVHGAAVCLRVSGLPEPADSSPLSSQRWPYGRLLRSPGVRYLRAGACALKAVAILLVWSIVFVAPYARACTGDSQQQALANCQAFMLQTYGSHPGFVCLVHGGNQYQGNTNGASWVGNFPFDPGCPLPPSTVCTTLPVVTISLTGKYKAGQTFPQNTTDPSTGVSVQCTRIVTAVGAPTLNQYDGKWYSRVTLGANPNPAGGTGTPGVVANADGSVPDPAIPTVPTPVPTANQPSPQICGGGSCYDPNTDTYTATDSTGKQTSVSGDSARSQAGGCSSTSSATICSGSPSAPAPPPPPASPISDPPNSLKSIDSTAQVNPSTGANQTVTTVVYSTPGTKTTSGQKTGDLGPGAPTSSSCTAGQVCNDVYVGAACGYDPSASGDPLLSAIAVDIHHVRCAADSNGVKASDFDSADHTLGDQTATPDQVFTQSSTTTDPTSVLDSSGFLGGGRSCPGFDPVQYLGYNIVTDNGVCSIFGMMATYILAMGYTLGALIIYRGRAS